jgi:hypothetical protein
VIPRVGSCSRLSLLPSCADSDGCLTLPDTKFTVSIDFDTFVGDANITVEALTYDTDTLTFLDRSFIYGGASRVLLFDYGECSVGLAEPCASASY